MHRDDTASFLYLLQTIINALYNEGFRIVTMCTVCYNMHYILLLKLCCVSLYHLFWCIIMPCFSLFCHYLFRKGMTLLSVIIIFVGRENYDLVSRWRMCCIIWMVGVRKRMWIIYNMFRIFFFFFQVKYELRFRFEFGV